MARRIPPRAYESSATMEIRPGKTASTWDVYVMPSEERIAEAVELSDPKKVKPVKMLAFDKANARVRIRPVYTRPNIDGEFDLKNEDVPILAFDWHDPKADPDEDDVIAALGRQPYGMTIDLNYGLGFKKDYRFILDAVVEMIGDKPVLYIGENKPLKEEFKLPLVEFEELVSEIDRIDGRAQTAENEVKGTTAYNVVAKVAGLEARPFSLGRNKIRQIIQGYASDPDFDYADEVDGSSKDLSSSARAFAIQAPLAAEKIVSDVQLTRLEIAIAEFEELMLKNHNENKWQKFFQNDPFLLSFAFGYPITFVNGQPYVGGRKIDGKGEKIGDFLYKNSLNNNAVLIEIKKPQTPLLKEYRDGVFGPHEELSGGITQVLDQRYRLVRSFPLKQVDNEWVGEKEVNDFEVDCVLVAGCMSTEKDQRRSFQLYRKNSHSVRVVTFDEMLQQLKQVREFLRESKPAREAAPTSPTKPKRKRTKIAKED